MDDVRKARLANLGTLVRPDGRRYTPHEARAVADYAARLSAALDLLDVDVETAELVDELFGVITGEPG